MKNLPLEDECGAPPVALRNDDWGMRALEELLTLALPEADARAIIDYACEEIEWGMPLHNPMIATSRHVVDLLRKPVHMTNAPPLATVEYQKWEGHSIDWLARGLIDTSRALVPTPEAVALGFKLRIIRETMEASRAAYQWNNSTLPIYRPRGWVLNHLAWRAPLQHTCPHCGEKGSIVERVGLIFTGKLMADLNRRLTIANPKYSCGISHRCRSCRARLQCSVVIDENQFALAISIYESEP